MLFYQTAIVSVNIIGFWKIYLLWRQRNSCANDKIPATVKAIVTSEEFAKSQAYAKDKVSFGIVRHVRDLITSNITLFARVSAKLYYWAASVTGLAPGSFFQCFAFSVTADVISTAMDLPFEYYEHFVLEEKHGFNKMTRKVFVLDAIKLLALRVAIAYPLQTGLIQWVVRKFGDQFPLYLFSTTTAVMILLVFIFPIVIQPMFNKFNALDPECQLYGKIKALAERTGFPMTTIYTMDGSRRSSHSNAYIYGLWWSKHIVLFDTLIDQIGDDDEQILAVLSHEIGHWKLGHIYYNIGVGMAQMSVFLYGAKMVMFNKGMYEEFGFRNMDPVIGFEIFSSVFLGVVNTLLEYARCAMTRAFEFQADRFAVSLGYGAKLRHSLVVMTKENRSSMSPDPLYSTLTYTHPPITERLDGILTAENSYTKKTR